MKNFQTVVQELLHNHERQRRYIALLTALCMLMAFTVSIILIEPAESMTGELACDMTEHIHSEECFTYTCGLENDASHVHSADCRTLTCGKTEHVHSESCYIHEDEQTAQVMQIDEPEVLDDDSPVEEIQEEPNDIMLMSAPTASIANGIPWFNEEQKEVPTGAKEFPSISSVTITVDDKPYDAKDDTTVDITKFANNDRTSELAFKINYSIYNNTVDLEHPYIYYRLPAGITIPEAEYGELKTVTDGSIVAGYYSISKEGLIVIRFTDDYIKEHIQKTADNTAIDGYIEFDAIVERDSSADGDRNLDFKGRKFKVQFQDKNSYDLAKKGDVVVPEKLGDEVKVKWTITASTYGNSESLANMVVKDEKFPANGVGVTITPPECSNYVEWQSDGSYKFKADTPSNVNNVTFTFTETIDKETFHKGYGTNYNYQVTNNATLSGDGLEESKKAEATVEFNQKPDIQKFGQEGYYYTDSDGTEKIRWTITVKHPYTTSLKGYQIQDDAFKNATILSVKNKNGDDIKYSLSDDTLTLDMNDNVEASQATIVYETDAEVGVPQNNKATLKPPTDVEYKEDLDKAEYSVTYEYPYQMKNKNGTYDYVDEKITWTVGANVKDTTLTNVTLNEYWLQDDAFSYLNFNNHDTINVTAIDENNQALAVKTWGDNFVEFSNNARLTISGNKLTVSGNLHDFTMSYQTDPKNVGSDGTVLTSDTPEKKEISNTVDDKYNNGGKPVGVDVTPRDVATKVLTNSPATSGYIDKTQNYEETLNWKINLVRDNGFSAQEVNDEVNASVSGSNHVIDPESIVVRARTDSGSGWVTLDKEQDYTVTIGTDNKSFTLNFIGDMKQGDKNYRNVEITYSSKVSMNSDNWSFKDGKQELTFTNQLNTNDPVSWTYTAKDKNYIEDTSVTINKQWNSGNGNTNPPDDVTSIEYYLQRRLGESGTWENIYYDEVQEQWVTADDPEAHTYTLEKSSGWSHTWDNLPKDTTDHNQLYYYQAVEVTKVNGYNSSNGTPTNGGYYTITNNKQAEYAKYVLKPGTTTREKLAEGEKISLKDLTPVTFTDNEYVGVTAGEYYVIGYEVDYTGNGNSAIIYDEMPDEPFIFLHREDTSIGENDFPYHPDQWYDYGGGSVEHYRLQWNTQADFTGQWLHYGTYNDIPRTAKMGFSDKASIVVYYLAIPVDKLQELLNNDSDGEITVDNTISMEGAEDVTRSLTITKSSNTGKPEVGDSDLLTKTINDPDNDGNVTVQQSAVEYYVVVNPDGEDISNTDYYDITDHLKLSNWSGLTESERKVLIPSIVDVKIEELEYTEQDDGSIEESVVKVLSPGEYQYHVDNKIDSKTEKIKLNGTFNGFSSVWSAMYYNLSEDYKGETIVTLSFTSTDEGKGKSLKFTINDQTIEGKFDEETGIMTCSFKLTPNDSKQLYIFPDYSEGKDYVKNINVESVTYEKDVSESYADLVLTVPDGKPLKITYSYSFTDSEGNYVNEMQFDGENEVSVDTGNASGYDNVNKHFTINQNSSAGIQTGDSPKLVKYNVSSSGELLSAKFYIAQYTKVDGVDGWYFTSSDTPENVTNSEGKLIETRHKFDFSVKAEGNKIPATAHQIEITSDDVYKLALTEGKLYKIIEIKVPNDGVTGADQYEANDTFIRNLGGTYSSLDELIKGWLNGDLEAKSSTYQSILNKFVAVHYFKYKGDVINPEPDGYSTMNVMTVQPNGTIVIPNNELIDITASKTWDSTTANPGKVEFTLYWSESKGLDVNADDFEAKAHLAEADELGVRAKSESYPNGFENPVTIEYPVTKSSEEVSKQSYTWNDLPNGKADKPIYYYVKETAYTVDDTEYKLNSETGNIEGSYHQVYTNNGTNKDGTIRVRNTLGLSVTKVWKTADNQDMNAADIPVNEIDYEIYGKKSADAEPELLYTGKLESSKNWTEIVPEDKIRGCTDITVKEVTRPEQVDALYGYNSSPNYNVTGTIGEITIVNKNNTPSKIDVSVEKVWGDGADLHKDDSVEVWLYQSSRYLTQTEIETLSKGESLADNVCKKYNYDGTDSWTLNSGNDWKMTWENLPYKGESGSGISRYYYYAIESVESIPEGFTASYSRIDQSTQQRLIITNAKPSSLTIRKEWEDQNGNAVDAPVDEIEVEIYRRAKKPVTSGETDLPKEPIKIMALGDSITNGYNVNGYGVKGSYRKFLYKKLTEAGLNITMVGNETDYLDENTEINVPDGGNITYSCRHEGHNGYFTQVIDRINESKNSGLLELIGSKETIKTNDPEIILLMVGTNDIMKDGIYGTNKATEAEYQKRYEDLFKEIYNQKSDVVLYVLSPTPINSDDTTGGEYIQDQTLMDENTSTCISGLKKAMETVENEGHSCRYIDTNKLFRDSTNYKDLLRDYCHPNETGYKLMGEYIANQLINDLGGTTTTDVPENLNGVPADLTTNTEYEKVDGTYTLKAPDWTLNQAFPPKDNAGNEYVYYVVEKSTGNTWEVQYDSNGQTIKESGSTITLTNTVETLSLKVKKNWINHTATDTDKVQFNLYRTTNKGNIPKSDLTPDSLDVQSGVTKGSDGEYSLSAIKNGLTPFTLNMNADTLDISLDPPVEGLAWSVSGNTITIDTNGITSEGDVETTMKISDGYSTISIKINITSRPFLKVNPDKKVIFTAGESTPQLTATMSDNSDTGNVTYTPTSEDIISVSSDGTITAKKVGETDVTVSCSNAENQVVVHVVVNPPKEWTVSTPISVPVDGTFKLNMSDEYSTYSFECNSDIVTVDPDGTVHGVTEGEYKITIIRNNNPSDKKEVTVSVVAKSDKPPELPNTFGTIEKNSEFVKLPIKDGYEATEINLQMDLKNATGYLQIIFGDNYARGIKVAAYSGKWEENGTWNMTDCDYSISINDDILTINAKFPKTSPVSIENKGIENVTEQKLKYVLTCENASGDKDYVVFPSESATSISLASLSEPMLMSAAEPTWTTQDDGTEMWSEEYTISSSGGIWEKTIPNLPLKDADGNTYYYWVVETNNDGFTKTYRFNDADATQDLAINAQSPGDGEIVITNKQKESSTTTMPSTGGNGAEKCYTIGGMLMLMSACGWAMHRRKRVIPH